MKLQEIYDLGISMAIKADPRGEEFVKKLITKNKKAYEELSEKKKKIFDMESFHNPYSDSRIFFGVPDVEVKTIISGIDVDGAEIVVADRLREKGTPIDLVITHHPVGTAYANLHDVMSLQTDVYANVGVPINVADALMRDRQGLVQRKIGPANHNQVVDAARLLNIPFLGLHTIWDNIGDHFMKHYLAQKEYDTVGEILDHLMELPEYIEATKGMNGPQIDSGSASSRAGKVVLFFTGGTNPSKEVYIELAKAGVGTIVDMHMPEESLQEMKKLHVNVINTGHMASDSIGANIFFDEVEKRGVTVIPFGGLVRVKREAKK